MRLIFAGAIAMSVFSLSSCKTIYHKLTTGDHDATGKSASITKERIRSIQPEVTTAKELDEIFDGVRSSKWTYRQPFWITWEGRKFKIDMAMAYKEIKEYEPQATGAMMVYAWKEQRFVRAYLYKGIVQLYIVSHLARDEKGKQMIGPLDNYDAKLLELETMNGLGCDREIYNVVSLGREPFDPEEFDKYCRPLIIEGEK